MAILFGLGAIGGFGLSQRDSFETQRHSVHGAATGEVETVHITPGNRIAYGAFGVGCMVACLYFIARSRRDDLPR